MAKYIIFTLLPEKPAPSESFRKTLSGATLRLFDRKASSPGVNQNQLAEIQLPVDLGDGNLDPGPPYYNSSFDDSYLTLKIEVDPSGQGFPDEDTVDLVAQIESAAGDVMLEKLVNYNFVLLNSSLPSSHPNSTDDNNLCPTFSGTNVDEYKNVDANNKASKGYLFIPVSDGSIQELFREDGKAPNFQLLKEWVEKVLQGDGLTSIAIEAQLPQLSFEQCLHIARELSWSRFSNKPPKPQRKLGKMYEFKVDTDGVIIETDNESEKRAKFEGELEDFYKQPEVQAQQLAENIFKLSCAIWAQEKSRLVTKILFRLPTILPDPSDTSELLQTPREVIIDGLTPGYLTIDARFFYAMGVELPQAVGREARYEQFISSEQQILLDAFAKAEEDRIIDVPATNQSAKQVVRLARAQHANRPELPVFDADSNTEVNNLIEYWSDYQEELSFYFWKDLKLSSPLYLPSTTAQENAREGHSDLIIYLLVQGHSPLFDDIESLTSGNDITIAGVSYTGPLEDTPEAGWVEVYNTSITTDALNESVTFLPPGNIAEKAGYFSMHALSFFNQNVAVAPSALDLPDPQPIPYFFADHEPIGQLGIDFDNPPSPGDIETAITQLFPSDACARDWMRNKVDLLIGLHTLTATLTPLSIRQTVMETLYALGITHPDQIAGLSEADFKAWVIDTVLSEPSGDLSPLGQAIWDSFGGNPPSIAPEVFSPINPGNLVDCRPPGYATQLGQFAYLQDLLAAQVAAEPVSDLLSAGYHGLSMDELEVHAANAEIDLPQTDLCNQMVAEVICARGTGISIWRPTGLVDFMNTLTTFTDSQLSVYFKDIIGFQGSSDIVQCFEHLVSTMYSVLPQGLQAYIAVIVDSLTGIQGNSEQEVFNAVAGALQGLSNNGNPIAGAYDNCIQLLMGMSPADVQAATSELGSLTRPPAKNPVAIAFVSMIQGPVSGSGSSGGQGSSSPSIGNTVQQLSLLGHDIPGGDLPRVIGALPPRWLTSDQDCAYEKLASAVSGHCGLPYHLNRDISEHYLQRLGCSRFDLSRTFSQSIHAFPFQPDSVPSEFRPHLYRLPVRHEQALEYLGISAEEYHLLYAGLPNFNPVIGDPNRPDLWTLFGFSDFADFTDAIFQWPVLLEKLCLDCCEFQELVEAEWIEMTVVDDNQNPVFSDCSDCDIDGYLVDFPGATDEEKVVLLWKLFLLSRLYRQIQKKNTGCYTLAELTRLVSDMGWMSDDPANPELDPHFLEQFVALDMLRTVFGICPFFDHEGESLSMSALLAGPDNNPHWEAVLGHFVNGIVDHCDAGKEPADCHRPEYRKLLVSQIELAAYLAGFRSDTVPEQRWHHQFTNIIRFAERLYRICASPFSLGQLQFILTADEQLAGDDPAPLQTRNEAREYPFDLPDNELEYSLASLREKLLAIALSEDEIAAWDWPTIDARMRADFSYSGFQGTDLLFELGAHFFPGMLERLGYTLTNEQKQFRVALSNTAPLMWNTGSVTPFRYDPAGNGELFATVPLSTEKVLTKLQEVRQLTPDEQEAVQKLLYAPVRMLAPFAFLFPDFNEAKRILIETKGEEERWHYFQQAVATYYRSCEVISEQLTNHLGVVLGKDKLDPQLSWKILSHLYADDNPAATDWEQDTGQSPAVQWEHHWQAGAFSALYGLKGTGIKVEYRDLDSDALIWREVRGSMEAFSPRQNSDDSPVAGIIPAIDYSHPTHISIANIRNGFAFGTPNGDLLGGAQGWEAHARGLLFVEETGIHQFRAGAPTPEGEIPDFERVRHCKWRLELKRGSKVFHVLDHNWSNPATPSDCSVEMHLKRGVYEMDWYFQQPQPGFTNLEEDCPQPTGWAVKWIIPAKAEWHVIPIEHLYADCPVGDLSEGLTLPVEVSESLAWQYHASVRGMRRTMLRALSAGKLLHGLGVSAEPTADSGQSEAGYLLANPDKFAGLSYYHDGSQWQPHLANFDLNFLPVRDNYCVLDPEDDQRWRPSPERIQALFDWFERVWEMKQLRHEAAAHGLHTVWQVWHECSEQHLQGAVQLHLQNHLGVRKDWFAAVSQFHENVALDCSFLEAEEWTIRVWKAVACIHKWNCALPNLDFSSLQIVPAKWLSVGFDAAGLEARQNLMEFVAHALILNSDPPRYNELKAINDSIRDRESEALRAYFRTYHPDSNMLQLIDCSPAGCRSISRVGFGIQVVQGYLRRVRLHLEMGSAGPLQFSEKERLTWENRLSTYAKWHSCRLQKAYPEDYVEHDILAADRKSRAFAFLEEQLHQQVLTLPVSGGTSQIGFQPKPSLGHLLPLQERQASVINARVGHKPPNNTPVTGGKNYHSGRPDLPIRADWRTLPMGDRLTFWLETAKRLGQEYIRVPAAGVPAAELRMSCTDVHCCPDCGPDNHLPVDEYYFWLLDSTFFPAVRQKCEDWMAGHQLAELLHMEQQGKVYLAWAEVHRGRLQQMGWSSEGVMLTGAPRLVVEGRFLDSLYLVIDGGESALQPNTLNGDPIYDPNVIKPGFRFDLATSNAVVLPQLDETLPNEELTYWFAYHEVGAPMLPKGPEGTSLLVAGQLQNHCQFAAAKDWLDHSWNPFERHNEWLQYDANGNIIHDIDLPTARARVLLLAQLDNLHQWITHLHQANTEESLGQAGQLLSLAAQIMGPRPKSISVPFQDQVNLANFTPLHPGLNRRLLCLYDTFTDLRALLDHCLNAYRTGCHSVQKGAVDRGCLPAPCCTPMEWCIPSSPYRFQTLLGYAKEYAGQLSAMGDALLSAFEKGEQETLALMREGQAKQIADLSLQIKKNLAIEADWQVQALEKTLEITKTRLVYYQDLINVGLIAEEQDNLSLLDQSMILQVSSQVLRIGSQPPNYVPTLYAGPFPLTELPGGKAVANWIKTGSEAAGIAAGIQSTRANKKGILASFVRRLQEWEHQVDILTIEVKQIEIQILAAQRRLDNARHDLDNHQLQLEHAEANLQFLREKFTGEELYHWQRRELAQLYHRLYECTLQLAYQAQMNANIEQGYTRQNWLEGSFWDNYHEGLLAGRKLSMALRKMEQDFMNQNHRHYELSKSISLALEFPRAFLQLRYADGCMLSIPEELFAKDYPSHYCRMIRSVALTIPCVAGPYTNINCTLTLMGSKVRISPRLASAPGRCPSSQDDDGYLMQERDERFVILPAGDQAMATSRGVNDSGYHQFDFRDERKLIFEHAGVAAQFCLDMPVDFNRFDKRTISDVILEINYRAKEGGEVLGLAARAHVKNYLPGNGEMLMCLDEARPDEWYQFQNEPHARLAFHIGRRDFAYIPGAHQLFVDRIELFVETASCPPCESMDVYFQEPEDSECIDCDDTLVRCVQWKELGGLFHGVLPRHLMVEDKPKHIGYLKFPEGMEIRKVYLLYNYGCEWLNCEQNNHHECHCDG